MPIQKHRLIIATKRLTNTAILPTSGSEYAIGLDLYADGDENTVHLVASHGRAVISTGIAMAIPVGFYGRVAPRSGLALKNGIDVLAGVIDSDYRGEICVLLINHSINPVRFKAGDRVAQLIIERAELSRAEEVTKFLEETSRGANGFGSTGS
jgi:dUTP pyrophosphatase